MPDYLDADRWPLLPAWWAPRMKPFAAPPTILCVHCGDVRPSVALYLHDPIEMRDAALRKMSLEKRAATEERLRKSGAVLCNDGHWRRQVCTHAAWRGSWDDGQLVQCSSLHASGWGTGSATWRGQVVQRTAIHVELPGPPAATRPDAHITALQEYAAALLEAGLPLAVWLRHSAIASDRRDPGPGLPNDWASDLGLTQG